MKKQLPKRHELDVKYTWNMANLFKDETSYEKAFEEVLKDVDHFCKTFENHLSSAKIINEALEMYQDIQARLVRLGAYASLQSSTDSLSESNQMRQGKAMIRFQGVSKKMAFFSSALLQTDDALLKEASSLNAEHANYLEEVIKDKKTCIIT